MGYDMLKNVKPGVLRPLLAAFLGKDPGIMISSWRQRVSGRITRLIRMRS